MTNHEQQNEKEKRLVDIFPKNLEDADTVNVKGEKLRIIIFCPG